MGTTPNSRSQDLKRLSGLDVVESSTAPGARRRHPQQGHQLVIDSLEADRLTPDALCVGVHDRADHHLASNDMP
jgi:hypothetical protein